MEYPKSVLERAPAAGKSSITRAEQEELFTWLKTTKFQQVCTVYVTAPDPNILDIEIRCKLPRK